MKYVTRNLRLLRWGMFTKTLKMNAKNIKLSNAQRVMIQSLRKNGKLKCDAVNRLTYMKLIALGLVDYDSSYDYIILTDKGKQIEL